MHATVEGPQLSGANAGGGPKGLQREGYGLRSVFPGTKGIAPSPIAATAMSASVVVGITRSYTAAWLGRMSGGIQGREIQSRWGMSDKPSHHKTDSCSCWH